MFYFVGVGIIAIVAVLFVYGVVREAVKSRQVARAQEAHDAQARTREDDSQARIRAFLSKMSDLAQPGVPVQITDRVSTDLLESRIGGRPAWPIGKAKPEARGAAPLCFLAQINLGDMPALEGFPETGLLQFFFAADDLYGLSFPEKRGGEVDFNNDIHVVYHAALGHMEEWEVTTAIQAAQGLQVPFDYSDWWAKGFALEFEPAREVHPSFDDYRLTDRYGAIEKSFPDQGYFQSYADRWSRHMARGMVIGGHPFFSQMDPRYYIGDLRDYSLCLMSLESVRGKIVWGDSGTGSFLIRPEELAERRFDKVLSNYDSL